MQWRRSSSAARSECRPASSSGLHGATASATKYASQESEGAVYRASVEPSPETVAGPLELHNSAIQHSLCACPSCCFLKQALQVSIHCNKHFAPKLTEIFRSGCSNMRSCLHQGAGTRVFTMQVRFELSICLLQSFVADTISAENAFLTLFFVNITYAIYCLCTLPQGSDNKVTMTMESPEKSRKSAALPAAASDPFAQVQYQTGIGGSRMTPVQRSNPASRPSTPYASSPISKPIVPRSGSASHKQQQQAAAPGSSPVRLGNDTPTSKLRAALLGSQAHQSSPGRGSPSRGVASTPPRPGTTPFGGTSHSPSSPAFSSPSSQVHTPARDESLREAAFLSRHSPSESCEYALAFSATKGIPG